MGYSVYPTPTVAAARFQRTVVINSTQSWTAPADVTSVEVIMCGGGGGGGGAGASEYSMGGGGSVDFNAFAVTPNTAYTITIGAGGAGGAITANALAGTGGTSSFGALWSVTGGVGSAQNGVPPSTTPIGIGSRLGGGGGSYASNMTIQNGNPGAFGLGGGGAGTDANGRMTAGTNGGGSTLGTNANGAQPGLVNTGGGGGAGRGGQPGAAGGSGVAIIRFWSAL